MKCSRWVSVVLGLLFSSVTCSVLWALQVNSNPVLNISLEVGQVSEQVKILAAGDPRIMQLALKFVF